MPKAFSDSDRRRIEARLLATGKRLINRVGLRLLSVDDVVREVGISKGSFYSFFPSREEFIMSVFESWETEYRGALIREISEGEGGPRERFERFFVGVFGMLDREPGMARLGMKEIQSIIDRLPPERIAAHQAADSRALEEAFEKWVSEGLLPPELVGAIRGVAAALFSIAVHREDFPPGSYEPTIKLIAEALAMRIAAGSPATPLRKSGGGRAAAVQAAQEECRDR